jgi:Mrp family chromosome partitioning ATPase
VVIGVTSPNIGDGKTTVAMALAASLTMDFGAEVILVDADLNTQSVARSTGWRMPQASRTIDGTATLEKVRHRIAPASMSVVTAGHSAEDPPGLHAQSAW